MGRWIGLIAMAATLLIVAPATARSFEPIDQAAQLQQFLPISRAAWPGSPCEGHEMVAFEAATSGHSFEDDGREVIGLAGPDCDVTISSAIGGYRLCVVLTHELGHLAGAEHSSEPSSAMAVPSSDSYRPCMLAALAPLTGTQARRLARSVGLRPRRCVRRDAITVDCVGGGRWMRAARLVDGTSVVSHELGSSQGPGSGPQIP